MIPCILMQLICCHTNLQRLKYMLAADVQPIYIHHFDQWPNQPFDPKIEDGEFLGRGVDDNKGNLLMALQVSAVMAFDHVQHLCLNKAHNMSQNLLCAHILIMDAVRRQ